MRGDRLDRNHRAYLPARNTARPPLRWTNLRGGTPGQVRPTPSLRRPFLATSYLGQASPLSHTLAIGDKRPCQYCLYPDVFATDKITCSAADQGICSSEHQVTCQSCISLSQTSSSQIISLDTICPGSRSAPKRRPGHANSGWLFSDTMDILRRYLPHAVPPMPRAVDSPGRHRLS